MPELPELTAYKNGLEARVVRTRLEGVRLASPFLLRSVSPSLGEFEGRLVSEVRLLGKRIVFAFEGDLFLVLHLMITGRLRWRAPGASLSGRKGLAAFDFERGALLLTEAGTKKRASLHAVEGEEALRKHDPGGIDVMRASLEEFGEALSRKNHTLKRSLTDPKILCGIGNTYSDEILHRARLSPLRRVGQMDGAELGRLFEATRAVLNEWIEKISMELDGEFPETVKALRPDRAVHGRFREPCPDCGAPIQRIVYAASETNYCAGCQTDGKILADRALSRLLKEDWPRRLEDLE